VSWHHYPISSSNKMGAVQKINLLRGYLLSATQHGNKPPSRHEAESLKRRAHHSPYTCTLTTLTFPENNPLIQTVHGKSV
ncbi:hypothetical protein, partial [Escherichia coli]